MLEQKYDLEDRLLGFAADRHFKENGARLFMIGRIRQIRKMPGPAFRGPAFL